MKAKNILVIDPNLRVRQRLTVAFPILLELLGVISILLTYSTQNFSMYIASIFILSLGLVLALERSIKLGKTWILAFSLTMIAIIPLVSTSITGIHSVLTWDYKAQEIIVEQIQKDGRMVSQASQIYRSEYISYPSVYVLWAVISQVTSIPPELIAKLPLMTLILYLLFAWVSIDIARTKKTSTMAKCAAISVLSGVFLLTYQLTAIFIYQNFGRTLLLFCLYILVRSILQERVDRRTILILLPTTATLITSHSESSIALVVFVTGLFALTMLKTDVTKSKKTFVLNYTILVFVIFSLNQFWQANYLFNKTLVDMLINTLTNFLGRTASIGIVKFNPSNFTRTELSLMEVSILALGVLVGLWFVDLAKEAYSTRNARSLPLSLGPLVTTAASFVILMFLSPFKSDLAFRFLVALATALALFFIERVAVSIQRRCWGYVLCLSLIALVLVGFFTWGGGPLTNFSPISLEEKRLTSILDRSSIMNMLNVSQTITILDSPNMPYFYTLDYLGPRIPMKRNLLALNLSIDHYDYKLLNGLYYPRFILQSASDLQESASQMVIGSSGDALTFFGNMSVIYSNGHILIEKQPS